MEDFTTLGDLATLDPGTPEDSKVTKSVAGVKNPELENLSTEEGQVGPASDIPKRLEELEQLAKRHVEQLNGRQQEVQSWKQRAEAQEKLANQLAENLQKLLGAAQVGGQREPQAPSVPEAFKQSLAAIVGYEPDDEHVQTMWSTLKPAEQARHEQGAITQQDVQKMLESDRNKQAIQQQTLQALVTEHPEFANNATWMQFYAEVLPTYQELENRPDTRVWVTPDPDGRFSYNVNGQDIDLRIMRQAATLYKEQKAQGQHTVQRNNQTTLGANGRQTPPKRTPAIVLPRSVIDELLADPVISKALQNAGKGGTKKEQAEWLWKRLPEKRKQELRAQYMAGQRNEVGAV